MKRLFILLIFCAGNIFSLYSQVSLLGTATPSHNWTTPYPMTQSPYNNQVWQLYLYLTQGEVKFLRFPAPDTIGGNTFPSGTGELNGSPILIPESGFYNISFDSSSFNYEFLTGKVGINTDSPKTALEVAGGISTPAVFIPIENDSIYLPNNVNLCIITGGNGAFDTIDAILPGGNFIDGLRLIVQNTSEDILRCYVSNNYIYIPVGFNAEFLLTYYSGWVQLSSSKSTTEGSTWQTSGNQSIDPDIKFLGTTDSSGVAFRTNNTERMRISPAGNFGIGTLNPDYYGYKMDISNETNQILRLNSWNNFQTGGKTSLGFYHNNARSAEISSVISEGVYVRLGFFTGIYLPPYLDLTEKMSILSQGNVGIGNTAPTQKLEVNGKIKIDDDDAAPEAGTIRWNAMKNDFEGFDGTKWLSLTKSQSGGWGGIDQIQEDEIEDSPVHDYYRRVGKVLAINDDYAVVGEEIYDGYYNGPIEQGMAYIYKFDPVAGCWNFLDTIMASDGSPGDDFGKAVAIASNYIIVGAPSASDYPETAVGKVYIFRNTGSAFVEEAILTGENENDYFGTSVSINTAGHLIIGSPRSDISGNVDGGKVFIYFVWGPFGSEYTELLTTFTNPVSGTRFFGESVNVTNNNYAYASSPEADKVYFYHYEEQGSIYNFYHISTLDNTSGPLASSEEPGDPTGWLIVGRPGQTVGSNADQGVARIYQRNSSTLSLDQELTGGDSEAGDKFGSSVDIHGRYCIVGAPESDINNSSNQGKAYIYYFTGGQWNQKTTLNASDGSGDDEFGFAVGLSGQYALIGAHQKDQGTNFKEGGTYFFKK